VSRARPDLWEPWAGNRPGPPGRQRALVTDLCLTYGDRSSLFSAVVEPDREILHLEAVRAEPVADVIEARVTHGEQVRGCIRAQVVRAGRGERGVGRDLEAERPREREVVADLGFVREGSAHRLGYPLGHVGARVGEGVTRGLSLGLPHVRLALSPL